MLVNICLDTFINIKHNNTIMHNDFSYQISWLSLVQQYCSMALIKKSTIYYSFYEVTYAIQDLQNIN